MRRPGFLPSVFYMESFHRCRCMPAFLKYIRFDGLFRGSGWQDCCKPVSLRVCKHLKEKYRYRRCGYTANSDKYLNPRPISKTGIRAAADGYKMKCKIVGKLFLFSTRCKNCFYPVAKNHRRWQRRSSLAPRCWFITFRNFCKILAKIMFARLYLLFHIVASLLKLLSTDLTPAVLEPHKTTKILHEAYSVILSSPSICRITKINAVL